MKAILFIVAGAISAFAGSWLGYGVATTYGPGVISTGFWTCCIGLALVAGFVLVQDYHVGNVAKLSRSYVLSVLFSSKRKLLIGGIGGFVGGAALAALGGGVPGWFVEGAILGAALCKTVPNISRRWTAVGGGVAGAVGYMILRTISGSFPNYLAVAFGDSLKGVLFGFIIFLSERVSRKAWLEILYPGDERRTISLGKEPIYLSNSSIKPKVGQLIYVANASPGKMYTFESGGVKCVCTESDTEAVLADGHKSSIGSVQVIIHTK